MNRPTKLQPYITCGCCNGRGFMWGQPRCQSYMSTYAENGMIRQCRYKAKAGSKYCTVHKDKVAGK